MPLARLWGGTLSSSDGQRFLVSVRTKNAVAVPPEVWTDEGYLAVWLKQSVDFVMAQPAPKSKHQKNSLPGVDVRNDKTIAAEVKKIKAAAKSLKKGEKPVLSSVKVIAGETSTLESGNVTDAYGRETQYENLLIRPVAYVPLDQGGNIYIPGGLSISENITAVGEDTFGGGINPQPKNGVFIDLQATGLDDQTTTVTQDVTIGFHQVSGAGRIRTEPGTNSVIITGNQIVKTPSSNSITVTIGTAKRSP